VPEGNEMHNVDQVLRALVSASRSLRLYPAASPIPRQSVEAVTTALGNVFAQGAPSLLISVAREGFQCGGRPVAEGMPGGHELADDLRAQGVSAIEFQRAVTGDDILKTLMVLARPAEEVRSEGGFGALLVAAGAGGIGISEIQLTVVDGRPNGDSGLGEGMGTGAAEELAADPDKLDAWMSSLGADAPGLQDGLLDIAQLVGPEGQPQLADTISTAFMDQPAETRDALLGLAMEPGPFQDLVGEMLRRQTASEIASSILGGSFGRNMLSLSNALTALPLDRLDEAVRAEIHSMLPATGHSEAEVRFLDHMIDVRRHSEPEPDLTTADQTYVAVVKASTLRPQDVETAGRAVQASGSAIEAAGVRTILTLIDQQPDAAQARTSAEGLVRMVPSLVASGQIPLADYVLEELSSRSGRVSVAEFMPEVATPETLSILVSAALADAPARRRSERMIRHFGEAADMNLVVAAVANNARGLQFAEDLIGKRMIELLNGVAPQAQWFQLCDVVAVLAREGDARSVATIETLMRRPEAPARKEIIAGLAAAGSPAAGRLLAELVNDPNEEVAVEAARALSRSRVPNAGEVIAARLMALDYDNVDFELGRELIGALARTPDPVAEETLAKLATRRAIIKRGHFNDIQACVTAAQQLRARELAS
jgi:hypothetical protein